MSVTALIQDDNITRAWLHAFGELYKRGEHYPLVVVVTGFENDVPFENHSVRKRLDSELADDEEFSTHTVANTIFPSSLWNPSLPPEALFQRYTRLLPAIRKAAPCHNCHGTYFERLITPFRTAPEEGQLAHILRIYASGNHRHSEYQASILDPERDCKNTRQQGFPCLQQVSFELIGNHGLGVTGFYATQYHYDKAYGNYMGLCSLGRFMAHYMNRSLVRMTCVAAKAQLKSGDTQLGSDFTVDCLEILRKETNWNVGGLFLFPG